MVYSFLHFFSGINRDHQCLDNKTDVYIQNIEDLSDDKTPLTLNKPVQQQTLMNSLH